MQETLPKISVVTPVYNAVSFLEAAILSVLAQGYPNLEYIIIDGGSTDGTVDIIKKYSDRISFWESCRDRGQTHALNKGFARATGTLRGWLNADEEYLPGTLFSIAKTYSDFGKPDLIYGNRMFLDLTVSPPTKSLEKIPRIPPYPLSLYTGRILWSDATFWTDEAHGRAGQLNEAEYPRYAMDVEWLLRICGTAKKYRYIDCPLSVFKFHGDNITREGTQSGIRLNEKIRRGYCKTHNVPLFKFAFGWFFYSLILRFLEKGLLGLIVPPKLGTFTNLFFSKSLKS